MQDGQEKKWVAMKERLKTGIHRSTTGGCRLSEPEAKCKGAKGAMKAWAGMECPQRRKQTKIGRVAGHETQWNAQPSANKESF